ncbi:hypothetical protein BH18ACT10_BH18ACT10_07930 [soil metagenome]
MSPASYDEIAVWYDERIREGPLGLFHLFVVPEVLKLAGVVEGRQICDLACGQGAVARRLAKRGANFVGVDVSSKMLDLARRYERDEPLGVTYTRDDAQTLAAFADEAFDGVVCNMALTDIPDLGKTLRSVARVLLPGGWFVFSIVPPYFQSPGSPRFVQDDEGVVSGIEVRDYFSEGFWRRVEPNGVRGRVGAYHRTLSTCVNSLVDAGLHIENFVEPRVTGSLAEFAPVYESVPAVLISRCRKVSGYGGREGMKVGEP